MRPQDYSVVIPTNKEINDIMPLLNSLANQNRHPQVVLLVRDRDASGEECQLYTIAAQLPFAACPDTEVKVIHPTTNKKFVVGQGVSYVRNFGRSKVKTDYMIFIDDDNICPNDMAEKFFDNSEFDPDKKPSIVAPLQYLTTGTVRPSLAYGFNYLLSRPRRLSRSSIQSDERYYPLTLASSNCLFGATKTFANYPFDESLPFVYEDLIMITQMVKSGIKIRGDTSIETLHEIDKRSKLSQLYINTPERAYQKAKHRLLLFHALQPNARQRFQFRTLGFVGQLGRLALHILLFAALEDKIPLWSALLRGSKDGLKALKAH